jgi:hypothetical protein
VRGTLLYIAPPLAPPYGVEITAEEFVKAWVGGAFEPRLTNRSSYKVEPPLPICIIEGYWWLSLLDLREPQRLDEEEEELL